MTLLEERIEDLEVRVATLERIVAKGLGSEEALDKVADELKVLLGE